jgi:hypothetical protein
MMRTAGLSQLSTLVSKHPGDQGEEKEEEKEGREEGREEKKKKTEKENPPNPTRKREYG